MPTIWSKLRRTAKPLLRTFALGKKEVFRQSLSFQVLYAKAFYKHIKKYFVGGIRYTEYMSYFGSYQASESRGKR